MNTSSLKLAWLLVPSLAILAAMPSSRAQTAAASVWSGATSTDWNDASNWTPSGIPTGVNAGVDGTSLVVPTITSAVPSVTELFINGGTATSSVSINAGGSLTAAGTGGNTGLFVGANGSSGTFTVQNGGSFALTGGDFGVGRGVGDSTVFLKDAGSSITVTGVNEFHIGWDGGGNGTINQSEGTFSYSGGNDMRIGAFGGTGNYIISGGTANLQNVRIGFSGGSVGVITQSGGTINHTGELAVGWGDAAGTYNMSGGTLVTSQRMRFGIGGAVRDNTFNQTGGSVTVTDGRVDIGEDGGPTNTYNISGGTLAVNGDGRILVGAFNDSTGTLNVSGTGAINTVGQITLGDGGTAAGTMNVSGGTVTTTRISAGGSGSVQHLNLNGGVLIAKQDEGNFIANGTSALVVNIQAGGATIDSAGHDIGIQTGMSGVGSLTKIGTNQLKLGGGAYTYTGNTIVNAGTLTVEGSGSMTFDINASGVNNQITGNGTGNLLVIGSFAFDLTDAAPTGSWTIVNSAGLTSMTFDPGFSVQGWTDAGSDTWTFGNYTFSEATGVLSAVPEPATLVLLCSGFAFASLVIRRRRMS